MASNDTLERRSRLLLLISPPMGANCGGGDDAEFPFGIPFPFITVTLLLFGLVTPTTPPEDVNADEDVVVVVELNTKDFVASILKLMI